MAKQKRVPEATESTIPVMIHQFPVPLLSEVEAYAKEMAGLGRPSKQVVLVELVRRGLTASRGDAPGGVRRGE